MITSALTSPQMDPACNAPTDIGCSKLLGARVASKMLDANDVVVLELEASVCNLSEAPTAGSHIDLHLPDGLVRQYSLVEWTSSRMTIAVKREGSSRGASTYLVDRSSVGDLVQVGGPRNAFPVRMDAEMTILIGGGIGITPLISMARELETASRPWLLYYAAASQQRAALLSKLAPFGRKVNYSFHYGRRFDLRQIVADHGHQAHYYACGPRSLLDSFREATASIDSSHVHIESFTPAILGSDNRSFLVNLSRTGLTIEVPPDKTLLHTLTEHGVSIAHSCEQGICGKCEVRVLSGIPEHRDSVLSEQEKNSNQTVIACCSRSLSPVLTLDV